MANVFQISYGNFQNIRTSRLRVNFYTRRKLFSRKHCVYGFFYIMGIIRQSNINGFTMSALCITRRALRFETGCIKIGQQGFHTNKATLLRNITRSSDVTEVRENFSFSENKLSNSIRGRNEGIVPIKVIVMTKY